MPDPPDLESVRNAIRKLEEIERDGDFARWSERDLSIIQRARREVFDPQGGLKYVYVHLFFAVRDRLKNLIRRLADEPKWVALAHSLSINLRPPQPFGGREELEQALAAMSRPWTRVHNRHWPAPRYMRPNWTEAEVELIRAVIYAAERHPHRFMSEQAREIRRAGYDLASALLCHQGKIDWKLAEDALDANVNRNFLDRHLALGTFDRFAR